MKKIKNSVDEKNEQPLILQDAKTPVKRGRPVKNNYCNNPDMLKELIEYKKTKVCSDKLAKMFMLISQKLSGHSSFRYYDNTIKEELVSSGIYRCMSFIDRFDVDRPNPNPFGYFSMLIWRAFLVELNKHYKNLNGKRKLAEEFSINMGGVGGLHPDFLRRSLDTFSDSNNNSN